MTDSGNSFKRSRKVSFDRLHTFHGGLRLPGHREITANRPIGKVDIPPLLTIPLQQHIGNPGKCLVKPGDTVYKGQVIAQAPGQFSVPVHASSSGTVIAVEERLIPHPSGIKENCVVIETDGHDRSADEQQDAIDYLQIEPARLCELVQHAGIVGMGGAGFPTRIKLCSPEQHIELLLINAAECEPYISCDNRLLQERATEVVEGIRIMRHGVQPDACIIAIEDNMQAAEEALRAALHAVNETGITITRVPEIYPSGGERQLIRILTGREVPGEGFPADIGIVCQNV
ncbi:MAG: RnfABCDGE type electron transport complex subunit C, partial [Gammaproteobacteria bacterium]|nr:RnfABCDGE type electron transport complex subunit C [Gammaproteobacteria bacterium]